MDFVKKNITLVLVLAITGLVSVFMIYLDYCSLNAYNESFSTISEYEQNLRDLYGNRSTLKPLQINTQRLNIDQELLKEKKTDLQRFFGKPYRNALKQMSKVLIPNLPNNGNKSDKNLTDDELSVKRESLILSKFKNFYEKQETVETDSSQLVKNFVKAEFPEVTDEQLRAARETFASQIATPANSDDSKFYTREPADDKTVDEWILVSLGLPRTRPAHLAIPFFSDLQGRIYDHRLIPGPQTLDTVKALTFDFKNSIPPQSDVHYYVRHFQMLEYFFWCLRKSKIRTVRSLERVNSIYGSPVNGSKEYLIFTYRANILCNLDSLRTLVNMMREACTDNRVFKVVSIAPVRVSANEVPDLMKSCATTSASPDTKSPRNRPPMKSFQGDSRPVTNNPETAEPESQDKPGQVLIGADPDLNAVIEFDYVIFIGDELKPKNR